jgi:hypothetical protein
MATPTFNDGNVAYGSKKITLPSGVVCVAESLEFDEPTRALDRKDELGVPNGAVYIPEKVTARGTLQLPSANTDIPKRNTTFALDDYRNEGPKQFVFTKIGIPFKQDDLLKFTFEMAEVLNPEPVGTPVHN